MEDIVEKLKDVLPFKDTIDVGDVVLVVMEESQNGLYGYVTEIEADTSRKDEWWHVSFSFLSIPIQPVTWTLRTPQMTGMEVFTMGGNKRFIKALNLAKKISPPTIEQVYEKPKLKTKKSGPKLKRVK